MVTLPSADVVFLAGIFGFALTLRGDWSPSSLPSVLMRFRGDVHVAVCSVLVTIVVAGDALPCLRLRELGGGPRTSSISGVASLCTAVSSELSCGSSLTLRTCLPADRVPWLFVLEERALKVRAVSCATFEVLISATSSKDFTCLR